VVIAYFVVSPRTSDGGFTVNDSDADPALDSSTQKRFYVILSGSCD